MNSKKLAIIALAAVLLVAIVIAVGFILPDTDRGGHEVKLPPETADAQSAPDASHADDGLVRVTVTKENVARVVETMSRPEMYTRALTVTTYWNGGSAETTVEAYVLRDISRVNLISEYETKSLVIAGGKAYTWYEGNSTVAIGSAAAENDEYQMLVTYEDIVSLPQKSILDAGYESYNGVDCIFAEYVSGKLGYITKCYVSLETGLVIGAERRENDTVVYTMSEASYTPGEPTENAFRLPDGTLITAGS